MVKAKWRRTEGTLRARGPVLRLGWQQLEGEREEGQGRVRLALRACATDTP